MAAEVEECFRKNTTKVLKINKNDRCLVLQLYKAVIWHDVGYRMRKPFCWLIRFTINLHLCTRGLVQNCILLISGYVCQNAFKKTFDFTKHRKTIVFILCTVKFFLFAKHSLWFFFSCLPYLHKYSGLLHGHFKESSLAVWIVSPFLKLFSLEAFFFPYAW